MPQDNDNLAPQDQREELRARSRLRAQDAQLGSAPAVGQLNWISLGPSATSNGPSTTYPLISGPVTGVAVADNGLRVYVASVNGGVFRSDDGGETFYPLMSAFELDPTVGPSDSLAIGAFAVHPALPDRIYVGSGEAHTPDPIVGVGPVVSEDGGVTWSVEPYNTPRPEEGSLFYGMAIDPIDPELAVGATDRGLIRRQPRNQDVPDLPAPKPQSYMIQMSTAGTPAAVYWDGDGLNTRTSWTGVVGAWAEGQLANVVATTVFAPFLYRGKPRFVRYMKGYNGANNAAVYELDPTSEPRQLQQWQWTQNMVIAVFELDGSVYLVRYTGAQSNATLDRFEQNGSLTQMWANPKGFGANWTALVPLVIMGASYLVKYNSAAANNNAQLFRWTSGLDCTTAGGTQSLPQAAELTVVELGGAMLLLAYEPANNGRTTLYRVSTDGSMTLVGQPQNLPSAAVVTAFTWVGPRGDEPRLFVYKNASTTLYRWGPSFTLVPLWTRAWDQDLLFMPFLMGYEWADRQAWISPRPLMYDRSLRGLTENRRVSSVVSVSDGGATVFYAFFWVDKIMDPAVPAIYRGRGQAYVSLDRGLTWEQLGVFPPDQGRVTLAVHPTNVRLVYAMSEAGKIYRFERDSGPEFSRWNEVTGGPPAESWFNAATRAMPSIAVSRSDEDTLFLGGDKPVLASFGETVGESGALYRCKVTRGAGARFTMSATYIGTSLPVGISGFGFSPVEEDLWVATAQGLFRTTSPNTTSASQLETMFGPMSTGLSTSLVNDVGQHPVYDAILFSAGEDGGCQRYAGDEVWTNVGARENGGTALVSPDGQMVIYSATYNNIYRSIVQGDPGSFQKVAGNGTGQIDLTNDVDVEDDYVLRDAPLTGARSRVTFGTRKPWVSDDFGGTWRSIPNDNASDMLPTAICAMGITAAGEKLYVATTGGQIWKYVDQGQGEPRWVKERDLSSEGPNPLSGFMGGKKLLITSIVIDAEDAGGSSFYVTLGGSATGQGGWQRVWQFSNPGGAPGGAWAQKSGPGGGPALSQLMNVPYYALAAYRRGVSRVLVAGAEIGVWQSTDAGATWTPWGEGLPEAPVYALRYFEPTGDGRPALLRAATYGRGVYERVLERQVPNNPRNFTRPVQLYMRANVLDRGLYNVLNNLPNPIGLGDVHYWDGTDIKVALLDDPAKAPSVITFTEFAALPGMPPRLQNGRSVRIYVQLHNRGILPARGARVTILLSPLSNNVGPPPAIDDLPPGFEANVQNGTPITANNWTTIAIVATPVVRAGAPAIVSTVLTALPAAGTYAIVALATSPDDVFTNATQVVATLVTEESKAIMKYLRVV